MAVLVELDDAGKQILINAEFRFKELCKSIPGANWDPKKNIWHMPVSWAGCLALRSTFQAELEIGPKLQAWAFNDLYTRVEPANALRNSLDAEGDPVLYPFQRAGVKFLATAKRALLADEPGSGKTIQAIRALKELQDQGEVVFPALVVCPNTIKRTWEREFAKWWPEVNVQIVSGSAVQRRKQFNSFLEPDPDGPQPQILIINWESLRSHSRLAPYGSVALKKCPKHGGTDPKVTEAQCEIHERELNKIQFHSVIADEIHRSKNPQSKQTRALWGATGDAEFRFALTGTPLANDATDLWAILHWLQPEEWPTKTKWTERMVDMMMNAFGGIMVLGIKPTMKDEFYASLNPRMRRMIKSVVLPWLPKVVPERRYVEMPPKQAKAYKQMKENMLAELDSGGILTVSSVLTQTLRLLQFASSYAELEEVEVVNKDTGEIETKVKVNLSEPSGKIDAFVDDIKNGDFGDESVAVSAVHIQLINLLSAKLTKEKIPHGLITGDQSEWERTVAMDDFQSGKTKFILFTAQAGGVGVTLTAARYLVRLERPYSLIDDKQVNDRVHRIGSEIHDSIIILDYTTDSAVEERVREILDTKQDNFEEVVQDRKQLIGLLTGDPIK